MKQFRKLKSLKFLYEINEDGVIRNVKSKKILSPYLEKNGYMRIKFENNCLGGVVRSSVHQLVAEAFIPNPDNLPEVNHKDSNRANNRVENLEWVTHSQNMRHSWDKGINHNGLVQYRNRTKKRITDGEREFESICQAAEWLTEIGRAKNRASGIAGVSAVVRGIRKTFGGFTWNYI